VDLGAAVDVEELRRRLADPVAAARREPHPLVAELVVSRLGPHSKGDDNRDAGEIEALRARDWYGYYRERLPEPFARIEPRVRERIERLVAEVESRPPSRWATEEESA